MGSDTVGGIFISRLLFQFVLSDGPVRSASASASLSSFRAGRTRADGRDHLVFAGIAFAGGVLLDGADRHALVRDLVVFAPRGERGEEVAVGVRRIGRDVTSHLLEVQMSMPSATAFSSVSQRLKRRKRMPPPSALWPEALATGVAVAAAQRPAGGGARRGRGWS